MDRTFQTFSSKYSMCYFLVDTNSEAYKVGESKQVQFAFEFKFECINIISIVDINHYSNDYRELSQNPDNNEPTEINALSNATYSN